MGSDLFAELPGVAGVVGPDHQSLDTTYYDTGDLRLARAGITVRRRAGGADAGWQAELPVGHGRRELHVPPERSAQQVPAELAGLVLAYTADRPLRVCAHIEAERDVWHLVGATGDVLVEVADDSVRSQALSPDAQPVRTWHEIVLAGGGKDLLASVADRLGDAGIVPSYEAGGLARTLGADLPERTPVLDHDSSAGAVVTCYLRTQVERLRAADVGLRLDMPDGVHDLRVAVRRLRSCLRVFSAIIDPDGIRLLSAELKWLSDVLGDARDSQVLGRSLTRAVDATPVELVLGPVRATIERQLARPTADTDRAVRTALASGRYLSLLDALDALVADPPYRDRANQPAVRTLPPLVGKAYRTTRRKAAAAASAEHGPRRDEAMHALRRSVKRLRYAVEAVEPVVGKAATRYRRRSKDVQVLLGDHHDLVVQRPVLRELGVQAHLSGANGFTFGLLYGRGDELALDLERRYPGLWRRLATTKARRWMRG